MGKSIENVLEGLMRLKEAEEFIKMIQLLSETGAIDPEKKRDLLVNHMDVMGKTWSWHKVCYKVRFYYQCKKWSIWRVKTPKNKKKKGYFGADLTYYYIWSL